MVKRSVKEWDKIIAEYYETEPRTTIKEYCKTKNVSTQQFHYNKKDIRHHCKMQLCQDL